MLKTNGTYELRPWMDGDAPSLARHANSRAVWDYVRDHFPHPYTEEDARAFIAKAQADDPTRWDLAIVMDGQAVGGVGVEQGSDVERTSAEIGYWIGERYRNRGIVSDAVRRVSEYIFEATDITHLYASVFGFNVPSLRVLEKAGFSPVGIRHHAAMKNGRFTDLHFYELLKPAP